MSEGIVSEPTPTLNASQSVQVLPFRPLLPVQGAMQNVEKNVFVLVRCTYRDDARWFEFLEVLKQQFDSSQPLTQSRPWTTIENKERLDGATMLQATLAFQKWVDTAGAEEMRHTPGPRYQYYIYVNEESIESVINPLRVAEKSGNFLVFVSLSHNLMGEEVDLGVDSQPEDYFDDKADLADESWKLIDAKFLRGVFVDIWDGNHWYTDSSIWKGPPFVHYRHYCFQEENLVRYPDPVGTDVYKMMKQIYGKGHVRSRCFEAPEAQTVLQRLRGYAGGFGVEIWMIF